MNAYTASEKSAAVRCVDCPSCGAKTGDQCHYIGAGGLSKLYKVPAHKRRVDKFYIDASAAQAKREGWTTSQKGEEGK